MARPGLARPADAGASTAAGRTRLELGRRVRPSWTTWLV